MIIDTTKIKDFIKRKEDKMWTEFKNDFSHQLKRKEQISSHNFLLSTVHAFENLELIYNKLSEIEEFSTTFDLYEKKKKRNKSWGHNFLLVFY